MSIIRLLSARSGLLAAGLTLLALLGLSFAPASLGADAPKGPIYSCTFTPAGWSHADWIRVKNPRGKPFGSFVQHDDCIANAVPANATPDELRGKYEPEVYASMVYKEQLAGNVVVSSTMAFTDRLAPLIVLAPEMPENAQGQKEYREHFEIIIFNEGVNVWRHFVRDGKLAVRLAAFARFPLEKNTKYALEVKKAGKTLTVSVAGHTFGYLDDALPDAFYAGITASEGLDRFYDFAVRR